MNRRQFLNILPFAVGLPSGARAQYGNSSTHAAGFYQLGRSAGKTCLLTPEGVPFRFTGLNQVQQDTDGASPAFIETLEFFNPCPPLKGNRSQLDYADVWDPRFLSSCDRKIRACCRANSDRRNLIAWNWGNTPTWELAEARQMHHTDWVSFIRQLSPDAAGKIRYVNFLLQRYHYQFQAINQRYRCNAKQRQDLLQFPFANTNHQDGRIFEDDCRFLRLIARQFTSHLSGCFKTWDPNHLQFGPTNLLQTTPDFVLREIAPVVDVLLLEVEAQETGAIATSHRIRDRVSCSDRILKFRGKPLVLSFKCRANNAPPWLTAKKGFCSSEVIGINEIARSNTWSPS